MPTLTNKKGVNRTRATGLSRHVRISSQPVRGMGIQRERYTQYQLVRRKDREMQEKALELAGE
jgi:hypothetical protein